MEADETSDSERTKPRYLERMLAEHQTWLAIERGLAKNSLEAYRRDLAKYRDFLERNGIEHPHDVTAELVARYVTGLAAETDEVGQPRLARSSIARAMVAVRSFHKFLHMEGHVDEDVALHVGAPKVPTGIPKALTEEEVDRLLGAVAGDDPTDLRDRAILETLYATGTRISELMDLDLGAVDLDDSYLRAFGKGRKERIVPLGRAARESLSDYLVRGRPLLGLLGTPDGADRAAVFLNNRGGRLTRQGCWKIVRRYGERVGLGDRISPHVLRHSCATHMVDRGADLRVVQELLGHARMSTTQVYTKVTNDRLREVYVRAHPRAQRPPL